MSLILSTSKKKDSEQTELFGYVIFQSKPVLKLYGGNKVKMAGQLKLLIYILPTASFYILGN